MEARSLALKLQAERRAPALALMSDSERSVTFPGKERALKGSEFGASPPEDRCSARPCCRAAVL